ncbi:MAG TPA: hypothetical protein VKX17_19335 [Planctomycetota bacterium]|nr:hypothetical protein [Planctomycetota bacterium]
MRKTKESLAHPPQVGSEQMREAQETENEERYDAVGGETSTEGVGRGFDASGEEPSEFEKSESSADGPLSGEMSDPPMKKGMGRAKVKRRHKRIHPANSPSNHPAANSSKTI